MVDEMRARGRPRTADGRRELVSARVSEAKLAAIDAARGETPRSVWVQAAIDAYLSPPAPVAALIPDTSPVPVYGYPADSVPAESVYGNVEPPCRHPAGAVEAGECGICHAEVWLARGA